MPFDATTYETEVKHPSLEGLIAWLETQPPETEYDYSGVLASEKGCLLMQWNRAEGRTPFAENDSPDFSILHIVASNNSTFGGALKFGRALQEKGQ